MDWLPPTYAQHGIEPSKWGMCPDQESKPQPTEPPCQGNKCHLKKKTRTEFIAEVICAWEILIYMRAIRSDILIFRGKKPNILREFLKWQWRINNQLLTKQGSLTIVFFQRGKMWIWDNSWKFLEFILKRFEIYYIFKIYAGEQGIWMNWKEKVSLWEGKDVT